MTIQSQIEEKLANEFDALHMQVINESSKHNVPVGSESHFKVVLVSDDFVHQSLLERHRRVNATLAEELQNKIHALALHTYTKEEWQQKGDSPMSPPCLGGGGS